jgi:hypothetical protein
MTDVMPGRSSVVIDRTFDLDDIVDAYRYVQTETKTGNVVLRVGTANKDAG